MASIDTISEDEATGRVKDVYEEIESQLADSGRGESQRQNRLRHRGRDDELDGKRCAGPVDVLQHLPARRAFRGCDFGFAHAVLISDLSGFAIDRSDFAFGLTFLSRILALLASVLLDADVHNGREANLLG